MAELNSTAPAVNAPIESGNLNEKETRPADEKPAAPPAKPKAEDDEEEDEDIDALIEDLESQDGHENEDEEEVCAAS
jgi:H+-transporting ATPase